MHAVETRRSAERGFTVAEILVAVTILAFVVTAVIGAIQFAAASTRQSTARENATNIGTQVIETARNTPYDSLGTSDSDPAGDLDVRAAAIAGDDFDIDVDVSYGRDADGRSTYKLVEVVVSWQRPIPNRVKLETAIMGKSNLVNTGDVLVTVFHADTLERLEGARVYVDPSSGSQRSRLSDENGESFFGDVVMGPIALNVTKLGYIADLTPVDGAQVSVDSLSRYTVYMQEPSTGVVSVTDENGNPIQNATVTIEGPSHPTGTSRTTDSAGRAAFNNLLKGSYTVQVVANGRSSADDALDITAGGQTVVLDVSLATQRTLNVTVRRPNGTALGNASVRVQGPAPSTGDIAGSGTPTASNGVAAFNLPGFGSYTITVTHPDYLPKTQVIAVTQSPQSVTITMAAATGSLEVRTAKSNGTARGRQQVRYRLAGSSSWTQATTDGSGYYTWTNLTAPADYQVERRNGSSWGDRRTARVNVGETTFVEFRW